MVVLKAIEGQTREGVLLLRVERTLVWTNARHLAYAMVDWAPR